MLQLLASATRSLKAQHTGKAANKAFPAPSPWLHTASWVDGETEAGGGLSRCMSASPFPWPPPRLRWGAGEERCLGVWRPRFEAAAKVASPGKASPRIPFRPRARPIAQRLQGEHLATAGPSLAGPPSPPPQLAR